TRFSRDWSSDVCSSDLNHDKFLRQLVEVVQLPPGEDALTVRAGRGQFARMRPGSDEHDIGADPLVADGDDVRIDQSGLADDDLDAFRPQPVRGVDRLGLRQAFDSRIDGFELDPDKVFVLGFVAHVDTQCRCLFDVRGAHGRGDQCFGGYAVGEYGCTTDTVAFDDRDVGSQLRSDEGRLVTSGSASDNDDLRHVPSTP